MKSVSKILMILIPALVLITACPARSTTSESRIDTFPARILRMVSAVRHVVGSDLLAHRNIEHDINKRTISQEYGADMARVFMAPYTVGGVPYLIAMTGASNYCLIRLERGSICGSEKPLTASTINYDGYLMVSDWIGKGNHRYLLMIMSLVRPTQTIIFRVTYTEGVTMLYNTFAKKQKCSIPPEGLPVMDPVYKVTTLSPTTFKIDVAGDIGPIKSAALQLSVGASSCALTVLSQKFRYPPSARSSNHPTDKP